MVFFVAIVYAIACVTCIKTLLSSDYSIREKKLKELEASIVWDRVGAFLAIIIWTIMVGRIFGWW